MHATTIVSTAAAMLLALSSVASAWPTRPGSTTEWASSTESSEPTATAAATISSTTTAPLYVPPPKPESWESAAPVSILPVVNIRVREDKTPSLVSRGYTPLPKPETWESDASVSFLPVAETESLAIVVVASTESPTSTSVGF